MTSRFIFAAALTVTSAIATAQQPVNGALRIVVVEGEDAVNIVQQNTAVAPVIEVRDRNNLPVPGAVVTFSIHGGKAATFGGASSLTVATNAAGQAAVTGTDASMPGNDSNPFSGTGPDGGAFQGTANMIFEGSRTGDTIAATLRWSTRGTHTAPAGTVFDNAESGAYSVTLRKTGEKNEGGIH